LAHVGLKGAIATFSDLSFSVPGALAHVHGTYGLLTKRVDLHGTLQVDNKLSKGSKGGCYNCAEILTMPNVSKNSLISGTELSHVTPHWFLPLDT
jgi:hypothetical protein